MAVSRVASACFFSISRYCCDSLVLTFHLFAIMVVVLFARLHGIRLTVLVVVLLFADFLFTYVFHTESLGVSAALRRCACVLVCVCLYTYVCVCLLCLLLFFFLPLPLLLLSPLPKS